MKIYNKYYRKLRQENINMELKDFMKLWANYKRLNIQYKILCFANFLEKLDIAIIEFPILRFLSMLVDFIRWKLYDLLLSIINGRTFNLYGVSCFCRSSR